MLSELTKQQELLDKYNTTSTDWRSLRVRFETLDHENGLEIDDTLPNLEINTLNKLVVTSASSIKRPVRKKNSPKPEPSFQETSKPKAAKGPGRKPKQQSNLTDSTTVTDKPSTLAAKRKPKMAAEVSSSSSSSGKGLFVFNKEKDRSPQDQELLVSNGLVKEVLLKNTLGSAPSDEKFSEQLARVNSIIDNIHNSFIRAIQTEPTTDMKSHDRKHVQLVINSQYYLIYLEMAMFELHKLRSSLGDINRGLKHVQPKSIPPMLIDEIRQLSDVLSQRADLQCEANGSTNVFLTGHRQKMVQRTIARIKCSTISFCIMASCLRTNKQLIEAKFQECEKMILDTDWGKTDRADVMKLLKRYYETCMISVPE